MTRNTVYQAESWSAFSADFDLAEPAVVVIPEQEDWRNAAKVFPGGNATAFLAIPDLLDHYLRSRGAKGLLSPHMVESLLGSIIADSFVPYLKMEKYRHSYVRALADFIRRFRDTSLLDLEEALAEFKTGGFSFKERDLVRIYREYERRLPDFGHDARSALLEFLRHTDSGKIRRQLGLGENEGVVFFGEAVVSVQPADRGQFREWAYTFICGLVDGEFPATEEFNFLQPRQEGLALGQNFTSVDYGRSRFYQLVRSTTGKLF